jgi:hypothetical protein
VIVVMRFGNHQPESISSTPAGSWTAQYRAPVVPATAIPAAPSHRSCNAAASTYFRMKQLFYLRCAARKPGHLTGSHVRLAANLTQACPGRGSGVRRLGSAHLPLLPLARRVLAAVLLPLWEGFDEWAHFAYAQRLASGEGLRARPDACLAREVAESPAPSPPLVTTRSICRAHSTPTGRHLRPCVTTCTGGL